MDTAHVTQTFRWLPVVTKAMPRAKALAFAAVRKSAVVTEHLVWKDEDGKEFCEFCELYKG